MKIQAQTPTGRVAKDSVATRDFLAPISKDSCSVIWSRQGQTLRFYVGKYEVEATRDELRKLLSAWPEDKVSQAEAFLKAIG